MIQKHSIDSKIIGGETFLIKKSPKSNFKALAGDDQLINKNESVTVSADYVNPFTVYNWYDQEGNFIFSGKDLTISPEVTKKYKLEVIDIDGFKDYDEVEIKVNSSQITNLTPNPATNSFYL